MSRPEDQLDPYRPPDQQADRPPENPADPPPDEQADPYRSPTTRPRPEGTPHHVTAPHPFGAPTGPGPGRQRRPGRGVLPLALLGLLALPLVPVGFAVSAAAVAWAVVLRRRARTGGASSPGATTALVLGVAGMAIPVALVVAFLPQIQEFADCMQGAQTKIAQTDCESAFQNALRERTGTR